MHKGFVRYVRKRGTGLYLDLQGQCTSDISRAHMFNGYTSIVEMCLDHGYKDMEIVLQIEGSNREILIPVKNAPEKGPVRPAFVENAYVLV